jgi:hypothetical protein
MLAAIQQLKTGGYADRPQAWQAQAAGRGGWDDVGGAGNFQENAVNRWLVSAGFGRMRGAFQANGITTLEAVAEMGPDDLLDIGLQDTGGQIGRLAAAIDGLRRSFGGGGGSGGGYTPPGGGGRSSRWETETVMTSKTSKSSKSSASRRSRSEFPVFEDWGSSIRDWGKSSC